jgi:hypothetical protein
MQRRIVLKSALAASLGGLLMPNELFGAPADAAAGLSKAGNGFGWSLLRAQVVAAVGRALSPAAHSFGAPACASGLSSA